MDTRVVSHSRSFCASLARIRLPVETRKEQHQDEVEGDVEAPGLEAGAAAVREVEDEKGNRTEKAGGGDEGGAAQGWGAGRA